MIARCHLKHGHVLDMAAEDEADVDRVRAEIGRLQRRRDPVAGAKAMLDQQQAAVGQMMQVAVALTESGPGQAVPQGQGPSDAFAAFEQMMDRFPEPPEGYAYRVPGTGRSAGLTPEGIMDVLYVEAFDEAAGRPE